jgi:hypothetical protein
VELDQVEIVVLEDGEKAEQFAQSLVAYRVRWAIQDPGK